MKNEKKLIFNGKEVDKRENDEMIDVMYENRLSRNSIYEKIQNCYKRIENRKESIKSVIQYSLVYLMFVLINAGYIVAINANGVIALPILSAVYLGVIAKDVSTIYHNDPKKIYDLLSDYNKELSALDNQYNGYSDELEKKNIETNSDNLCFGLQVEKNNDKPLIFSKPKEEKGIQKTYHM